MSNELENRWFNYEIPPILQIKDPAERLIRLRKKKDNMHELGFSDTSVLARIDNHIEAAKDEIILQYKLPQPHENSNPHNKSVKVEHLENMLTCQESSKLVSAIRIKYRNIKGKRLKLLFLALQELQLLPLGQVAANFHRCCNNDFDWDIASYPAMNDYPYNKEVDKTEFNQMTSFLKEQIK